MSDSETHKGDKRIGFFPTWREKKVFPTREATCL